LDLIKISCLFGRDSPTLVFAPRKKGWFREENRLGLEIWEKTRCQGLPGMAFSILFHDCHDHLLDYFPLLPLGSYFLGLCSAAPPIFDGFLWITDTATAG